MDETKLRALIAYARHAAAAIWTELEKDEPDIEGCQKIADDVLDATKEFSRGKIIGPDSDLVGVDSWLNGTLENREQVWLEGVGYCKIDLKKNFNLRGKMRDQIKYIVEHGGQVSFPYKEKLKDWISESIIWNAFDYGGYQIMHCGGIYYGCKKPREIDKVVDDFVKLVFTKKNIGLAIKGIRKHKLTDECLDDLPDKKLRALIKKYNEEYFDQDYRIT